MKTLPFTLILLATAPIASWRITPKFKRKPSVYKTVPNIETRCDYKKTRDKVTVSVRSVTQLQSKQFFDKNLIYEGYQPYQINIQNNSPDTLILRSENIGLPLYDSTVVAQNVKRNTVGWAMGMGVPIYFLINPFLMPWVVTPFSIWSWKQNKRITRNIRRNSIDEGDVIIIDPYARVKKNFFVLKSQSSSSFPVKLYNRDTQRLLRFNVQCSKNN